MSYRKLTVQYGAKKVGLLVGDDTTSEAMWSAIRPVLSLDRNKKYPVVDEEGFDVPFCNNLSTGHYTLQDACTSDTKHTGPIELDLEADTSAIMRALLGTRSGGSSRVVDGVIVRDQLSKGERKALQEVQASGRRGDTGGDMDSFGVPVDVQLLLMERMGVPAEERERLVVPEHQSSRKFSETELRELEDEIEAEEELRELQAEMASASGVWDDLEREMAEEFGMDTSELAFTAMEKWILNKAIKKANRQLRKKMKLRKEAKEFSPFTDAELDALEEALQWEEDLKELQAEMATASGVWEEVEAQMAQQASEQGEVDLSEHALTSAEKAELDRAIAKTQRKLAKKLKKRMLNAPEFVPQNQRAEESTSTSTGVATGKAKKKKKKNAKKKKKKKNEGT